MILGRLVRFPYFLGGRLRGTAHAGRDAPRFHFFLGRVFLSGYDSGLVLLLGACFWFVQPSMIPVESPSDQRGRSCSTNRGLGF